MEVAEFLHVPENDSLLASHGGRHMGAVVQVLHMVALQELQLAQKGLLRVQQFLDDGAGSRA